MWNTGLPVRSAILKPHAGQLVLKWVTIWESWLLIVFAISNQYFSYGVVSVSFLFRLVDIVNKITKDINTI